MFQLKHQPKIKKMHFYHGHLNVLQIIQISTTSNHLTYHYVLYLIHMYQRKLIITNLIQMIRNIIQNLQQTLCMILAFQFLFIQKNFKNTTILLMKKLFLPNFQLQKLFLIKDQKKISAICLQQKKPANLPMKQQLMLKMESKMMIILMKMTLLPIQKNQIKILERFNQAIKKDKNRNQAQMKMN